jgi:hypothetical protein
MKMNIIGLLTEPYSITENPKDEGYGDEGMPQNNFESHAKHIQLYSEDPSHEDIIIKNDLFKSLSGEAKFVIDLCLDTPSELINILMTPAKGKLSVRKLRRFLSKKWNKYKAERVINEVTTFVQNF